MKYAMCVMEDFEGEFSGYENAKSELAETLDYLGIEHIILPVPPEHQKEFDEGDEIVRVWIFMRCKTEHDGYWQHSALNEIVTRYAYLNFCGFSDRAEVPID